MRKIKGLSDYLVTKADVLEAEKKAIQAKYEELDDDYDSLKIMYNELAEHFNRLMNEKTDAIQEKVLYKFMLQRLIRMVLNSMNELDWYDTEIYYMCKTIKANDEEYEKIIEEVIEMIEEERKE